MLLALSIESRDRRESRSCSPVIAWVLAALLLVPGSLRAAPREPPLVDKEAATAISDFLQRAVARGDVPGVVALVFNRNRVLYREAFGKQDVAGDVAMTTGSI